MPSCASCKACSPRCSADCRTTALPDPDRPPRLVVAAAIVDGGRVLAAQRLTPPELAGRWEFPGGKVEPGETPEQALRRECREELGVDVRVGAALGTDVPLPDGYVLRLFACATADPPRPLQTGEVRLFDAECLLDLPWVDSDRPFLAAVVRHLRSGDDGR